jgi:hypothetical protein
MEINLPSRSRYNSIHGAKERLQSENCARFPPIKCKMLRPQIFHEGHQ